MDLYLFLHTLINLFVLLLVGFLIGYERQKEGKAIGVRTTTLVLLGAFVFTTLSVLVGDAPRMITGVAGAVGFIGSGVIFKGGDHVENLTTAVLILVLAGIGCMIGLGHLLYATIISATTFIILKFYKKLNKNA